MMQDEKGDQNDTNDLLPLLRGEIERAWNARGDYDVVNRLAAEHPSLADELYGFFADVIEAERELGRARAELAAMDDRVREYLDREGFRRAAEAKVAATRTDGTAGAIGTGPLGNPTMRKVAEGAKESFEARRPQGEPNTFLALLRHMTGESMESLATALEITPTFLVLVSDHGSSVPPRAQKELARRAASALKLNENALLASFSVAPQALRQAASRQKAYSAERRSFAQMVKSSGLDVKQREYWLALG
jgi:hypothetical protein